MKNILIILLGFVLLSMPLTATALQYGDFTYSSDGSAITITGYTGVGDAEIIPSTISGLPVTSIGYAAFVGSQLTGLIIPDSVTNIGDFAVCGCNLLTSVKTGNGITSIGEYTFYCCGGLSSIIIGNGVTNIGNNAFIYSPNLIFVLFEGNAPSASGTVFSDFYPEMVYYLSGTTGWGSYFCGCTTAMWSWPAPIGVSADYDGDNLADPAVYDEFTGTWKIKLSSQQYSIRDKAGLSAGSTLRQGSVPASSSQAGSGQSSPRYSLETTFNGLGRPGWASAAADYDGDRLADPGVYQESTGTWIILPAASHYATPIVLPQPLGGPGYSSVPEDYDGDGLADPALYQRERGDWQVMLSSANYYPVNLPGLLGGTGYWPVAADYDGDGLADPAIYDERNGAWTMLLSSATYAQITLPQQLGGHGWIPAPADYDGDGLADPAVRAEIGNEWIAMFSSGNYTPVQLTVPFE